MIIARSSSQIVADFRIACLDAGGKRALMTMTNALGRLEPVDPRDVWPSEAQDFTPWLLANA